MITNAIPDYLATVMRNILTVLALFVALLVGITCSAQEKQTPQRAPKNEPSQQPANQPPQPSQQDAPLYDPFHAQQDVEVGMYYMHKGDVDAAIGRFEDAIRLNSKFAKPRLLLAKAYEKKGDMAMALKYYKEYLTVFPDAPDAKKIQKRIDDLSKK